MGLPGRLRGVFQQPGEEQGIDDEEEDAQGDEPEAVQTGVVAQHQVQQSGRKVAAHLDVEPAADGQRQPGQQGMGQKQPGCGEGKQELDGLRDAHQCRGERQGEQQPPWGSCCCIRWRWIQMAKQAPGRPNMMTG